MQKDVNLRYQNATEMLKDLSLALKNPSGDFVVSEKRPEFETQRIKSIYDKSEQPERRNGKKDNKFVAFIKNHKALSIVLGCILLFVFTILITNILINVLTKADVQVPDLVGMEQSEAQKTVEGLKLKYEKKSEEYSKDIPQGYIISQDPSYMPNYNVKEGSTIKVIVSLGQNLVKMPKITGMKLDEATAKLEELGLKIETEEEYNSKVEAGYIIEQSVKEDTDIDAGETIKVKVSKGVEKVTVPDLIGKTEADAKSAIKSAGLKLKTTATTEDTTKDDGVVVKQSLEAGSEVDKDSSITITINKLPTNKKSIIVINIQSLLEGSDIKETEKVKVKITVNGTDYNVGTYTAATSSATKEISGTGTAKIQVKINDTVYAEKTITYGDTCTFE